MIKNELKKNAYDQVLEIFDKLFKYIPDLNDKNKQFDYNVFDSTLFLDHYKDMIEEIKCPICLKVSLDSEQCAKCQTLYCKKCIQEKKIINCLLCREKYVSRKIDRVLSNVMGHILINCENCKKHGNQLVKIKLSQIKEHLSKCYYSNYQCLKCNAKIFSKKKCVDHSFNCGYSDEICTYCKKAIKAYLRAEHEKKCAYEKIECKLCHIKIERRKVNSHKLEECDYRKILCKDCNEKYIFKEGHSKEKCLTIQLEQKNVLNKKLREKNKLLITIIESNINNIDISEENASFLNLKLNKVIRRQNTEANLLNDYPHLDPILWQSERKSSNKLHNIFLKSSLIKTEEENNYILGLFKKQINNIVFLYKMTLDGILKFHQKCDNISSTLSLIKIKYKKNNIIDKYQIYGGYAVEKWDCCNIAKEDPKAFIFSLTDKSQPFYKLNSELYRSIICSKEYGPSFGFSNGNPELWIKGKKGGYDNTCTFGDKNRDCTAGNKSFIVEEIEVYQIIFE